VVVPVLVSCQVHRTAYVVYARVYLALFGHTPPESGIPLRRLSDRIARELNRRGAVLVVCLDDAGYLAAENVLSDLVAGILRMHEGYPGTRAGVMLVVSDVDVDLVRCLDPATRSVLQASEVYFPLYTPEEIRAAGIGALVPVLGEKTAASVLAQVEGKGGGKTAPPEKDEAPRSRQVFLSAFCGDEE